MVGLVAGGPGDVSRHFVVGGYYDGGCVLVKLCEATRSDVEEVKENEIFSAKKEYTVDVFMSNINNGVYGSDEFMYTFKVKSSSRAYTHDWTECPFVHPRENARRRGLKKFNYRCVPYPEFHKRSCVKGDLCEYAHRVFESWSWC
ncbi:hypothetical protein Tco_1409785 [Tanacetum coccineum]